MRNEESNREWEIFANNVKWIRKTYGISKKKMASLLKIGIGSLNKIENGEMPPRLTIEIFFIIYKFFGIHPKDQLGERLAEKEQ